MQMHYKYLNKSKYLEVHSMHCSPGVRCVYDWISLGECGWIMKAPDRATKCSASVKGVISLSSVSEYVVLRLPKMWLLIKVPVLDFCSQ